MEHLARSLDQLDVDDVAESRTDVAALADLSESDLDRVAGAGCYFENYNSATQRYTYFHHPSYPPEN